MSMHAVITGDIVDSSRVTAREDLMKELKSALHWVEKKFNGEWDIYRGDSFQVDIPLPVDATPAAILIRSHLIAMSPGGKKERWDARISVGIGRRETIEGKVRERGGQAFVLSGKGLDMISENENRLVIRTPYLEADDDLNLLTRFADDVISNWSHFSAETIFWYLFFDKSQHELAEVLGKAQSTINGRLSTAKFKLIDMYIKKSQELIRRIN